MYATLLKKDLRKRTDRKFEKIRVERWGLSKLLVGNREIYEEAGASNWSVQSRHAAGRASEENKLGALALGV